MHHRVAHLIQAYDHISRAELARQTGLSKPTISSVVADLLASGLVLETGFAPSAGGRRAVLLAFNDRANFVVGMDLGGTTTRASLATLRGEFVATLREPTTGLGAEALVVQLKGLIDSLCNLARIPLAQILGVAIGTPGVVEPVSGRVQYAPNLKALEVPGFTTMLGEQLGLPVSLHNDVNLAALGEQARGAGHGIDTFAFVSVGTGLGFGLVIGGQLHRGSAGRAGELGYLRLTPKSPETIENVLSGAGIARRHAAAGGSGQVTTAFGEAERGEEPGLSVISELTDYLAWLLSALSTTLDPELLVLGGGIGQRFRTFVPQLVQSFSQLSPMTPSLTFSELGDEAGLYGAVSTALSEAEPLLYRERGGGLSAQALVTADATTQL